MRPKVIVGIVLAILLVVLVAQNTATVTYRFLFWSVSMSQVILFPLAALIGFLLGFIVGSMSRRQAAVKPQTGERPAADKSGTGAP
ncbi:MAG: LapA family protein [Candidatus Aminicenantes bacterium]|nr:LapA family protein [Candidatus Aminicenantes bacterium]